MFHLNFLPEFPGFQLNGLLFGLPDGKFCSDWPFTIYSKTPSLLNCKCKHVFHSDISVGTEFTFQDVSFVSQIFWSVEPKFSYHVYSDQIFQNFWANVRQPGQGLTHPIKNLVMNEPNLA